MFKALTLISSLLLSTTVFSEETTVYDESRDRHIPIEVNPPQNTQSCRETQKCPVAFVSSGYGVKHNDYSFLTGMLNELGYMVVSIQHELDGDPDLSRTPPFIQTRHENWQRGAVTLAFVRQALRSQFKGYDFEQLTLIGHSNGGDISALFSQRHGDSVQTLITMDHRRVPLPRDKSIQVLTIRASDFPADEGVLLTKAETTEFGACAIKIEKARHNDMTDYGPNWLKQAMASTIENYLVHDTCNEEARN